MPIARLLSVELARHGSAGVQRSILVDDEPQLPTTAPQVQTANRPRGEAETLAIVECRSLPAILCTDDHAVRDLVAGMGADYPKVVGTWDLLRIGYKRDFATGDELWQYSRTLHLMQHTPSTGPFDRGKFNSWLNG